MSWQFAAELARYGPTHTGTDAMPSLTEARAYCRYVARCHYENFSVATLLLPRRLHPHFHAVYAYCRWSDDLADETGDSGLTLLHWWRAEFLNSESIHPVMVALRATTQQFAIPPGPFLNLLTAFEHDQSVKRYATFADVLAYCANSANPVGRLVLHLFDCANDTTVALSDEICTGLQLANFWQDVQRDNDIGRVYLPQDEMANYGVSDADIAAGNAHAGYTDLVEALVDRTWGYFRRGAALLPMLAPECRPTVELFLRGGEATLRAIELNDYDTLSSRPTVGKLAKLRLLGSAWLRSAFHRRVKP